jgi:hypothetical protein
MSYICEFCGLRPECCACSVDLTEPRLVPELALADNIMAVENPRPYGLLNAPSASAFFSLLVELEEEEKDEDFELGPSPKWMRQRSNQVLVEEDEPMITTPIKADQSVPSIPKLERQTNMPEGIQIEDDDLQDLAIDLFPQDQDVIEYLKQPHSPEYLRLSDKLNNAESYSEFCSTLAEMKHLYEAETSLLKEDDELPNIDYCENCCDFLCECDKMVTCECGKMYHIDEPFGMCFDCEMDYRRQFSIDQANYPDDIRERYDSH